MVEQDLVISRALVELFEEPVVKEALLFRGGTALYKLHLRPAARFSEDIDLVQAVAGPIGPILTGIRDALDSWLGTPKRAFNEGRVTLIYRFQSEGPAAMPLRLKIEINTREHFTVLGDYDVAYNVESRWFTGNTLVRTYPLDELLGTKLRALYQRRKGRDLFDLANALQLADLAEDRIISVFQLYLSQEGLTVSRAEFEANLFGKLQDSRFTEDVRPLLVEGRDWSTESAGEEVMSRLLARLPGAPWKGPGQPTDNDTRRDR